MLTAKMKRRTTKNKRPKLLISVANDKIRDSRRSLPVLLKILSPRLTGDLRKSELEDQSQEKEAKRSRAGASKFNPRCGLCAPWGEYSQEFLAGGGVPPGSPSPDPISDQKKSFSDLAFRQKLCHNYLYQSANQKNFFKCISNSSFSISF